MCPDHELLSAWIDGEVPSPWRETIERHIGGCASCYEAAESLRRAHSLCVADARSLGAAEAAEAVARARVEGRLRAAPIRSPSGSASFWARRYAIPFPAAAAAALALALMGFALADSGRRNAELRMAMRRAFEATPVASSGMGIETVIDYLSKQNAAVNINITLPSEAFGAGAGEPFIVREADYQAGSRR